MSRRHESAWASSETNSAGLASNSASLCCGARDKMLRTCFITRVAMAASKYIARCTHTSMASGSDQGEAL